MAQIREIKKRMIAVKTIQRITKTMQMIATAKFTAAFQRTKASQPFTQKMQQLVGEVAAAAGEIEHPLIDGPSTPAGRELLLVITSDRGLCGVYNAHVTRISLKHVQDLRERKIDHALETAGKKGNAFFRFQEMEIAESHTIGDTPQYEDCERLANRFMQLFTDGEYDAIRIAYMRFVSNASQVPELMQLLPLKPPTGDDAGSGGANYEFSPSSEALLADLLPLTVKTSLFQAFMDAATSEHVMRMIAMKAATDNAADFSKTLNRQYNRARQAMITTELMEIIAGAAALE